MAGSVTGVGTTYGLPNYHGELFSLTPSDTPLLSAIGGLTGGKKTDSVEFEWQTYDLRNPSARSRLEGAQAPTAEQRVRANVTNVLEIHQEKVDVSYTRQATVGQYATPGSAPYHSMGGVTNPVGAELDWQTVQAIKQIGLDVNFAFINGTKVNPTSNVTARATGGLLSSISTNVPTTKATSTITGLSTATDTITETSTGLANNDKIIFSAVGDCTNIVVGRVYYVVSKSTNAFKVATSLGGSALTLGLSTTNVAYFLPWTTTLTTTVVDDLAQMAYDNGGLAEQATAALLVNSRQKRAITAAWAAAYQKTDPITGNIGGVNVTQLDTDFGVLNIMLDRHMPQDAIAVVSLEHLAPVFLEVPGKGVFFEEVLAKTGASDGVQIYGEVGLMFGNERAHALQRGLAV